MSEWWVHLEGDDSDLAYLSATLTSPDFAIQRKNGHFYLRSNHLDTLEDARKVKAAANVKLRSLNGLTRLRVHTIRPITVGNLERVDNEGRTHYIMLTEPGALALSRATALGGRDTARDPLPALLMLPETDTVVAHALWLYGIAEQPWKDLYPIYECIKSDLGGKKSLQEKGWVSGNQIERFTRTANHPEASGEGSRHGASPKEPLPNPMTEDEAWAFIRSLLSQWLEFKQSRP